MASGLQLRLPAAGSGRQAAGHDSAARWNPGLTGWPSLAGAAGIRRRRGSAPSGRLPAAGRAPPD
jgi:hypothetical protein